MATEGLPSPGELLYEIRRSFPFPPVRFQPRWLLAVPNRGDFAPLFWQYLMQQEGVDMTEGVFLFPNRFTYDRYQSIALNRNAALEAGLALGVEKVIFLDSDILIPRWSLKSLLSTTGDVVGAVYFSKYGLASLTETGKEILPERPFAIVVRNQNGQYGTLPPHFFPSASPVEVEAVGFGMVSICLSILERMERPWFQPYNEDFKFCSRVSTAGGHIWLTPQVVCGHQRRTDGVIIPVGWSEWETMMAQERQATQGGILESSASRS